MDLNGIDTHKMVAGEPPFATDTDQQQIDDLYNEAQYLSELVRWAYGKLHGRTFNDMDDALMLDRMKMYLEHGHAG